MFILKDFSILPLVTRKRAHGIYDVPYLSLSCVNISYNDSEISLRVATVFYINDINLNHTYETYRKCKLQ